MARIKGALVSASFGPPPTCKPMFSTLSSGKERSGCFGSRVISGKRGSSTGAEAGAPFAAGAGTELAAADEPLPGELATAEALRAPPGGCAAAHPTSALSAQAASSRARSRPSKTTLGVRIQRRIAPVITVICRGLKCTKTVAKEGVWKTPRVSACACSRSCVPGGFRAVMNRGALVWRRLRAPAQSRLFRSQAPRPRRRA